MKMQHEYSNIFFIFFIWNMQIKIITNQFLSMKEDDRNVTNKN